MKADNLFFCGRSFSWSLGLDSKNVTGKKRYKEITLEVLKIPRKELIFGLFKHRSVFPSTKLLTSFFRGGENETKTWQVEAMFSNITCVLLSLGIYPRPDQLPESVFVGPELAPLPSFVTSLNTFTFMKFHQLKRVYPLSMGLSWNHIMTSCQLAW